MSTMSEVAFLLGGNQVKVLTTQGRGFTPEEVAERALDKIISVGSQTHPAIRDQAEVFKDQIRKVLVFYMKEAIKSHHTTLAIKFRKAGHPEFIKLLDE
jgi:cephalosporin hydroxylase